MKFAPGVEAYTQWTAILEACADPQKCHQILEVHFADKRLRSLPEEVFRCRELRTLGLRHNYLKNFVDVCELRTVRDLDLSENQITAIPEEINQLCRLVTLNLDDNNVSQVPGSFRFLPGLRNFSAHHNRINDHAFSKLLSCEALQTIKLSANHVHAIPPAISKLKKLRSLDVSENRITDLPSELFQCSCLEELQLSFNSLKAIPDDISALVSLTDLSLDFNSISELPEGVRYLTRLRTLGLAENQLTGFPEGIWQSLGCLEELNVPNNRLACGIPESLGHCCTGLRRLNLSQNSISDVPASVGGLVNLRELILDHNQLSSIPESVYALTQLEILHLQGNLLTTLPASLFKNMKQLREVVLGRNKLEALPPTIVECTRLEELDLDHNLLTELPQDIHKLVSLQFLWVTNNKLTDLPLDMCEMHWIREVRVQNNPHTIPRHIVIGKKRHLLSYLAGRRAGMPEGAAAHLHVAAHIRKTIEQEEVPDEDGYSKFVGKRRHTSPTKGAGQPETDASPAPAKEPRHSPQKRRHIEKSQEYTMLFSDTYVKPQFAKKAPQNEQNLAQGLGAFGAFRGRSVADARLLSALKRIPGGVVPSDKDREQMQWQAQLMALPLRERARKVEEHKSLQKQTSGGEHPSPPISRPGSAMRSGTSLRNVLPSVPRSRPSSAALSSNPGKLKERSSSEPYWEPVDTTPEPRLDVMGVKASLHGEFDIGDPEPDHSTRKRDINITDDSFFFLRAEERGNEVEPGASFTFADFLSEKQTARPDSATRGLSLSRSLTGKGPPPLANPKIQFKCVGDGPRKPKTFATGLEIWNEADFEVKEETQSQGEDGGKSEEGSAADASPAAKQVEKIEVVVPPVPPARKATAKGRGRGGGRSKPTLTKKKSSPPPIIADTPLPLQDGEPLLLSEGLPPVEQSYAEKEED